MEKIKTITSHVGYARFLTGLPSRPIGYLPRLEKLREPYRYSPTVQVYKWRGLPVVILEVGQRRYIVYDVTEEADLIRRKESDCPMERWSKE